MRISGMRLTPATDGIQDWKLRKLADMPILLQQHQDYYERVVSGMQTALR